MKPARDQNPTSHPSRSFYSHPSKAIIMTGGFYDRVLVSTLHKQTQRKKGNIGELFLK